MRTKKIKSTMVELVQELEKLPKSDDVKEMIKEALAGEYHDFKNKKYLCGKVEAYNRLKAMGVGYLADRIAGGEFDEIADEEDIENLRKVTPKVLWETLGLEPK